MCNLYVIWFMCCCVYVGSSWIWILIFCFMNYGWVSLIDLNDDFVLVRVSHQSIADVTVYARFIYVYCFCCSTVEIPSYLALYSDISQLTFCVHRVHQSTPLWFCCWLNKQLYYFLIDTVDIYWLWSVIHLADW